MVHGSFAMGQTPGTWAEAADAQNRRAATAAKNLAFIGSKEPFRRVTNTLLQR